MAVEHVAKEYPETYVQKGKAQELRSKIVPVDVTALTDIAGIFRYTYRADYPPRPEIIYMELTIDRFVYTYLAPIPEIIYMELTIGLPDIAVNIGDEGSYEA
jgi:hypothetical protein